MARVDGFSLTICGVGALGSNLADNLARQGFTQLHLIDFDRVDLHNAGNQRFGQDQVGFLKVIALRDQLFMALNLECSTFSHRLTAENARKALGSPHLVVDAFDNSESRQLVQDSCRKLGLQCLHAGLNGDYGEVIWDERYRVPAADAGDICDYPLARNIVLLTVTVASEAIISYCLEQKQRNFQITLKDLRVSEL